MRIPIHTNEDLRKNLADIVSAHNVSKLNILLLCDLVEKTSREILTVFFLDMYYEFDNKCRHHTT